MASIGKIFSYDLVMYVFVVTTKINVIVFYSYTKENRWSSHFIHHFKIRVLDPFLSTIIFLYQVLGIVGKF